MNHNGDMKIKLSRNVAYICPKPAKKLCKTRNCSLNVAVPSLTNTCLTPCTFPSSNNSKHPPEPSHKWKYRSLFHSLFLVVEMVGDKWRGAPVFYLIFTGRHKKLPAFYDMRDWKPKYAVKLGTAGKAAEKLFNHVREVNTSICFYSSHDEERSFLRLRKTGRSSHEDLVLNGCVKVRILCSLLFFCCLCLCVEPCASLCGCRGWVIGRWTDTLSDTVGR